VIVGFFGWEGWDLGARLPWPELDIAICDIGRL